MCGIAGYVGSGDRSQLERAAQALIRRGPDDVGFYEADGVGFAFRRLSIIDLKGGHQPVGNENGTVWVMLNGEIYNHLVLREELIRLGHHFVTRSDTEVVVHGYEAWGEKIFTRIEGMFAVAIWDESRRCLLLARDRMGKKPLYYASCGSAVWFASEPKALLAADVIPREINLQALGLYFRTDAVPTPESIWKGMHKVPPASYMNIQNGVVSEPSIFWQLRAPSNLGISSSDAAYLLQDAVDKAVADRLVADVPLGIFLSGGIDSAVIAASAARQAGRRLSAFTIGFKDASHDETKAAQAVAEALNLDHHRAVLSEEDALKMLDEAIECLDEPLADPAMIPQLLLSRFAKDYVTVALAGDGGDELLYGYQHVPLHAFAMRYPKMWASFGILSPLFRKIPARQGYFSAGFKMQRLARGLGETGLWARDLAWRGACSAAELGPLFAPVAREQIDIRQAEAMLIASSQEAPPQATIWQAWSWGYLRSFLMDEVMVKVDRATMWFGIEGRSPLLDRRVVEVAFSIPDAYKINNWGHKRLFREMLKGVIPEKVLNRPKHGFGVPVADWLRGPLRARLREVSTPQFLAEQSLFNQHTVTRWIEEHDSGRLDRRKELWAFLMFQTWYVRWILTRHS